MAYYKSFKTVGRCFANSVVFPLFSRRYRLGFDSHPLPPKERKSAQVRLSTFFWFSELPYILIYGGGCCICSSEPHGVKEIHTKLVNQWMKENPDSISEPKERRTRLTSVNQLVGETQFQTVNLCG